MSREVPESGNIIRLAIAFEAAIFLVALTWGWIGDEPPLELLHANWAGLLAGTVATIPLAFFMWVCSRSSLGILKELMRNVEEQIVPLFRGASTRNLLFVSALAGIGEECLFRGVLQAELTGWLGLGWALALSSLIFGLAHLITPTYAVFAGLIGAYFGVLMILTDNLLVPVMAHALYDYVALRFLLSPHRRWTGHLVSD